ncbi:MAG: N-acetyltransferase family protein [Sphingomonadales bacterium]
MLIRTARHDDADAIWAIIGPVIRAGETYTIDPEIPAADAIARWMGKDRETFVAIEDGAVVGTYYLRRNQEGGGAHVANCGYVTAGDSTGRGVARCMCEHSMDYARSRGFSAMQFNFVVASNERAVGLWRSLGFAVVGRLPGAFRHPALGEVDALVMYRKL